MRSGTAQDTKVLFTSTTLFLCAALESVWSTVVPPAQLQDNRVVLSSYFWPSRGVAESRRTWRSTPTSVPRRPPYCVQMRCIDLTPPPRRWATRHLQRQTLLTVVTRDRFWFRVTASRGASAPFPSSSQRVRPISGPPYGCRPIRDDSRPSRETSTVDRPG
jgi:hypothetical protein